MLCLSIVELEKQGVPRDEAAHSSQISCSNKLFTRAADFPISERLAAIEFSKTIIESGVYSFIAESDRQLTVWKETEKKSSPQANLASPSQSINPPSTLKKTLPNRSSLTDSTVNREDSINNYQTKSEPPEEQLPATKRIVKTYRGVSYTVEVPINQGRQTPAKKRKYRGAEY